MSGNDGRPTRALITSPAFADGLLKHAPGLALVSDEARAASLAATWAGRPETASGETWVFAIGSLMWNPPVEIIERGPARLAGYHRALCLHSDIGRGTVEEPGLVFALDHGGSCNGIALRLPQAQALAELDVLWRIEMIDNAYSPRRLPCRLGNRTVPALAFVMNHAHPRYIRLDEAAIAHRVAHARGHFGSCYDCVAEARKALVAAGLVDHKLDRILAAADRLRA